MTVSLEHLTTSSILPVGKEYTSARLRKKFRSSLLEKEMGNYYGLWEVLPYAAPLGGKDAMLWCRCHGPLCSVARLVRVSDLRKKNTVSCGRHHTQTPYYLKVPARALKALQQRYNRIQGATNPRGTNPAYAAYRARATKNLFGSVEEFVRHVWETLPHDTYAGVEIDRKDNLGDYAPGNLRLSTRLENAQNREANIMVDWEGERMSASLFARQYCQKFHSSTVIEMLKNGATPKQIVLHQTVRQPGVTSTKKKKSTTS